jgi:hypothetical protein
MKKTHKIAAFAATTVAVLSMMAGPVQGAVTWNGSVSSDWANVNNWGGGLPSTSGAGDAIINQGSPNNKPQVSSVVGATVGNIYVSIGAGLNIVSGGQLSTISLITGQWGNSNVVDVSGGTLNISNNLLLGNSGYDGKLNISGGSVTANNLSINAAGGAKMNIGGTGSFIAPVSNLSNINYWITNNIITANNRATGWTINVDTVSNAGNVVLTAVPEPSVSLLATAAMGACCFFRTRRKAAGSRQ